MSYLFILVAVFLFSTLELTSKLLGDSISPIGITIYRFMLGGIIMLPLCLKKIINKEATLSFKDMFSLSLLGIINIVISMLSLQLAVYYGEASLSAILISANPVFVAILAKYILKESLSFVKIIGIIVGIIGVITIIGYESFQESKALNPLLGIIFGCVASFSFGLYTILSKKNVKKHGNVVTNTISFIIGSIVLGMIALISKVDVTFEITWFNVITIVYLGIFVSGLAYLSYFEGLKSVPTTTGAILFFLKPVIVSILAFIMFHETIYIGQFLGIALVIMGINIETIVKKTVMIKKRLSVRNKQ